MEELKKKGRKMQYAKTGFTYEDWMEKEGIPVYEALAGIEDVTELPRQPWARHGGYGTFIQLQGMKGGGNLMWVVEIPAGGALEPEKHMYDEIIYIIRGRGLTEVWQVGGSKRSFEWGEGSLFAIPTNAWHRLVNGGREPVLIIVNSNAAVVMNVYRSMDFVYNCDYNFTDRYTGQADYFLAGTGERYKKEGASESFWDTNFVPDVRTALLVDHSVKAASGLNIQIKMSAWPNSHISQWPVGKYHKAHCHGPGATFLVLKSEGYALLWPQEYGPHPFQNGHGDKVVKSHWTPNGLYCVFGVSFHQHFNIGPEPARTLVFKGGGHGFDISGGNVVEGALEPPAHTSVRKGGTLIEYEDEDPEIRRMWEEELRRNGVESTMKPVVYRTDPLQFSYYDLI